MPAVFFSLILTVAAIAAGYAFAPAQAVITFDRFERMIVAGDERYTIRESLP